jgi:hypothetical protein
MLPVGAALGECVPAKRAALGWQSATEQAVILTNPAGGLDREIEQWSRTWQYAQMALASAALRCSPASKATAIIIAHTPPSRRAKGRKRNTIEGEERTTATEGADIGQARRTCT